MDFQNFDFFLPSYNPLIVFRKSLLISTCLLIIKFDDLFTDLVTTVIYSKM